LVYCLFVRLQCRITKMWMNLREIFRKGLKPVTLNNASDYRPNGRTD